MSVLAQAIKELVALGVSGDALIAAIERLEAAAARVREPTLDKVVAEATREADRVIPYIERKRTKDRERRAREREELRRLKAERESLATTPATTPATTRDPPATEGDATATDRDPAPHASAQVVITSSSLRSEDRPPEKPSVSTPKGVEKRGCALPADWTPDADGWAYATETLGPDIDPHRELDRFRDYWRAVPGAKGRKLDWPATWRNWCRNAADNLARRANAKPGRNPPQTARQDRLARSLAGLMEAVDERESPLG